jgi:hypothetical protein
LIETCKAGHAFTEENTLWHKDKGRNRLRKRCKECKNAYRRTGTPNAAERSIQVTDYAHEDVEDLIRFGATYKELITRTGFSSWDTLHRSLKRRGRQDLIDAIRAKKELV